MASFSPQQGKSEIRWVMIRCSIQYLVLTKIQKPYLSVRCFILLEPVPLLDQDVKRLDADQVQVQRHIWTVTMLEVKS